MRMVNVINATIPVIITITDEDIALGAKKDPAGCAAAISCCRVPRVAEARVHTSTTYLRDSRKGKWVRYRTPSALRFGMIAFDRGGTWNLASTSCARSSRRTKREACARARLGRAPRPRQSVPGTMSWAFALMLPRRCDEELL